MIEDWYSFVHVGARGEERDPGVYPGLDAVKAACLDRAGCVLAWEEQDGVLSARGATGVFVVELVYAE